VAATADCLSKNVRQHPPFSTPPANFSDCSIVKNTIIDKVVRRAVGADQFITDFRNKTI
jgi:hypothetical protein